MKCTQFKVLWPKYLAGEIEKELQQDIIRHLKECQRCQQINLEAKWIYSLHKAPKQSPPQVSFSKKKAHNLRRYLLAASILLAATAIFSLYNTFIQSLVSPDTQNDMIVESKTNSVEESFQIISIEQSSYFSSEDETSVYIYLSGDFSYE